jgi:hypothetical protein
MSTGPRTDAGKAVSRFNPLRHGLTSRHLILPGENPEDFHALHEQIRASWAPDNPDEESLVAKIAEGEWRMIRARRVETATLKLYMERVLTEDPQTETPDYDRVLAIVHERYGKELDRLRRYETTISRELTKTLRELEHLVHARVNAEPETECAEEPAARKSAIATQTLSSPGSFRRTRLPRRSAPHSRVILLKSHEEPFRPGSPA